MLTSKKNPPPVATVKMVCPAGCLVPREPGPPGIPKERRFYNWPRDAKGNLIEDRPDFPLPHHITEEVVVEVPANHHHLVTCIHKGPCRLQDEAVAPVDPPSGKGKGKK